MDKLLLTSATKLAEMIRTKQVSAEDVVRTYISQAQKVNPLVNAIVKDRYEIAIREALEADLYLKSDPDDPPSFLGVPFTTKDICALEGFPATTGLVHRKHDIQAKDATAVARLRAAGAIPIGVTNVPVLASTFESTNKLYGQSNNPYDLSRTPGGSSGGEGAIIASAGSAFGLGTDGAGSIRIPSSFCGIFGHKSSAHLVPNTGHFPPIHTELGARMICFGPMTRFSEDLMPLLRIMAGPDNDSPYMEAMQIGDETKVKLEELTYFYGKSIDMESSEQDGYSKAIELIRQTGAKVQEIDMGIFKDAFDIGITYFSNLFTPTEIKNLLGGPNKYTPSLELMKNFFGKSDFPLHINFIHLMSPIMRKLLQRKDFFKLGLDFTEKFNSILGTNGVLIFPTLPFPATKHGTFVPKGLKAWSTPIFNVSESPSTAIPMGLNSTGLPVGIQVVSRKGNDHLTIAVARYFESKGFGWNPPKIAE